VCRDCAESVPGYPQRNPVVAAAAVSSGLSGSVGSRGETL
jgi:hypothetical protein